MKTSSQNAHTTHSTAELHEHVLVPSDFKVTDRGNNSGQWCQDYPVHLGPLDETLERAFADMQKSLMGVPKYTAPRGENG